MKLGLITPFALVLLLPAAISLVACGGSSTSSGTVSAIAISPDPCAVGRTDSKQMSALATFPDGSKRDITSSAGVAWSSADTSTATVNASGVVVGVNAGITAITAKYEGATGSVDCTVGP